MSFIQPLEFPDVHFPRDQEVLTRREARRRDPIYRRLVLLACAGAALCCATGAGAQEVTVYRSSRAGDRLTQLPNVRFTEGEAARAAGFTIDEDAGQQKMLGFGASFNEAGMISLNSLTSAEQEKVLIALFDPEKGAGFSAMKTVIGATDFMSAGPFYTHNDTPGDVEMKKFSIERDLGPNGLVPYIKRSKKYGNFILQATMDYPPNWMLFDPVKNQDVDPKYYDALALYYLRYLEEYAKQGIPVDFLSLFNEPMGYTKIPLTKIRDLIKNHVGPLFHRKGVQTRLQTSDHIDRALALKEIPIVMDDPDAAKYISSLAYHGYDWRRQPIRPTKKNGYGYDELKDIVELRKRYPRLHLWMTEVCYWNGGTPWAKPLPRYEFEDGDFWGTQLFNDIEAGASGWTYWNMILDQTGGPWLIAPAHGNPDHNQQQPVIIINRETKEVTYTGLYYYLAHFSKFVRPTSTRIGTNGTVDGVRCLTFKHTNGQLVSQVMNSTETEAKVTLTWNQKTLELILPAASISTYIWSRSNAPAAKQ